MKKEVLSLYKHYENSLEEKDVLQLKDFFTDVKNHLNLPKHFENAIIQDFENAILYYANNDVPINEALLRLSPSKLGGFYKRPALLWFPLDDMAKIYPMSVNRIQMAVYRISIYLKEDIVPELLQMALSFTIKRFPIMSTSLKKGIFWNYLDTTKRHFAVKKEDDIPCQPINIAFSGSVAFKVLYYNNRISIEFFHALADGTGALIFLNTLTAEYIRLTGANIASNDKVLDINGIANSAEMKNEFSQFKPSGPSSGFGGNLALQMSGNIAHIRPCRIIQVEMESDKLRAIAKSKNVSVTAYLLGIMFIACKYSTDQTKGILQLQVPVNLRKYYETKTLRNFAMYCKITLDIDKVSSLDDILPEIDKQLTEKSSKETMDKMIMATVKLVRNMRFIPLFILRPVAKIVYGLLGDKMFTSSISNLGVVDLPEDMAPYVDKYNIVLGSSKINKAGCTCISFNNKTVLTITKSTTDPSFEEKICQQLEEAGLKLTLEGSEIYEA